MVTAKKPTETAVVRKLTRPRRAASGDVAPDNSDKSFEDFAVKEEFRQRKNPRRLRLKTSSRIFREKIRERYHNPCKPSSMAPHMMMR